MAQELSRFFDYTEEKGNEYSADEFSEFFRTFFSDGVLKFEQNLLVYAQDAGMLVHADFGAAMVQGYGYWLKDNGTGVKTLSIAAAHSTHTRIDRVILRLNKSLAVSNVQMVILPGTPAAAPIPAPLTREGNIFEISLAKVAISPGALSITAGMVTDERQDNELCGMVEPMSIRDRINQGVKTTDSPTFNVVTANKIVGAVFQ